MFFHFCFPIFSLLTKTTELLAFCLVCLAKTTSFGFLLKLMLCWSCNQGQRAAQTLGKRCWRLATSRKVDEWQPLPTARLYHPSCHACTRTSPLSLLIVRVQSLNEGQTKFHHDGGIPATLTLTVRLGPQAFDAAEQLKDQHQSVAAQDAVPAALIPRT